MLYQIKSSKSMDEIERGLQESAARHQFGVIAVHDVRETLAKKGVDLAMECRIYEVCNPHQAKKVLDADGALSLPHLGLRLGKGIHPRHHAPNCDDEVFCESRNRACGTGSRRGESTDDERCSGLLRWNPERRQSRVAPQKSHFG